jgi:hypothetical protein
MDAGLTDVKRSVRSTQFVIFRLLENRAASQESNGCWVNRREKERPFHTIRRHFPPTGKRSASEESSGCWVNRCEKERPFHTIRRHFLPTGTQRQLLRSLMDAGLTDVKSSVRSTQFVVIFRLLEHSCSCSGVE